MYPVFKADYVSWSTDQPSITYRFSLAMNGWCCSNSGSNQRYCVPQDNVVAIRETILALTLECTRFPVTGDTRCHSTISRLTQKQYFSTNIFRPSPSRDRRGASDQRSKGAPLSKRSASSTNWQRLRRRTRFLLTCAFSERGICFTHGSVSKPCTPVVHIKIAGKWMFIPLKMVFS